MSLPADTAAYMIHRPPLRLVQRLLCVEDDYAEAETVPGAADVMIDPDGKVEAAAMMEIIAQAYAAAQGYKDRMANKPPALGYLVGASDFRIEATAGVGQRLRIVIRSSRSFDDFYLVDGQVFSEGHLLASGVLKIWVSPATGSGADADIAGAVS